MYQGQAQTVQKPQQIPQEDDNSIDELASTIYQVILGKYPNDAGKITGMIVDLGINEMIKLTNDRKQLDIIIDQAHELLKKND